ncbi:uncharacterized protein LOC126611336 [Malus sylvestris]|uniref:uncharacterized protein LOC126611336 n=1 Tax=Malus sylvestris TaxID=3752 RepID=UPI0021ACBDFD|nr:uncharacterized protein LOC126611336 [Malus sylvestris]XP_050135523.1 uncharacterized protein LOC126611336 [Malus sylvestris]XP_050135524.1 uncharacterized protein LOC126611336 [Malus sylvestris]
MTRGKSFTLDQDVAVCNARLSVSLDPLTVVSQPKCISWDQVYQKYVEITGDQNERSRCSVQSRWKIILGSCNQFHECLTKIEEKQSGLTESNKVLQANILYLKLEKKRFAFSHCWEILQHNIKWKGLTPAKRSDIDTMVADWYDPPIVAANLNITSSPMRSGTRTMATDPNVDSSPKRSDPPTIAANLNINSSPKRSDPHSIATNPKNNSSYSLQSKETLVSQDTDKDPYYTAEFLKRKRSRRRAEKEAYKRSKVVETLDSRLCDVMEKLTKQLAEADDRKAKIAERKVKVMEEANEREQREHDDRIMSMDTTNMEPRARAYYEQRKNDVYFKTMAHSKNSSNMDLHTIAHYDHSDIYAKMMARES